MSLLTLLTPQAAGPGEEEPTPVGDLLAPWRAKLEDTSTVPAVLVACGDSLTDMDATTLEDDGWSSTLARMLATSTGQPVAFYDVNEGQTWTPPWTGGGVHVVNTGTSGRTSYSYMRPEHVAPTHPDLVLHMIGMNDYNFTGRTPVQVADEIVKRAGMVDAQIAGRKPVHVIMVEPRDTSPNDHQPLDWWDRYSQELARIVDENSDRMVLVDVDAAFGTDTGLRGSDDIHLTTAGYLRVAETVHAALTEAP